MSKVWPSITLGILVPSGPHWHAKFGMSLVGATSYFMLNKLPNCEGPQGFFVINERGSILPQLRQNLVEKALAHDGVTHVLFIDSDESFPPNAIWRLVSHGLPVVGVAFPIKKKPSLWTAWKWVKDITFSPIELVTSDPPLIRVDRIGTGMLLVEAEIFRQLPMPWFSIQYKNGRWMGEDWWFCWRLQESGIQIMCDVGLSLRVGHVGDYEYTAKDIGHDEGTSDRLDCGQTGQPAGDGRSD